MIIYGVDWSHKEEKIAVYYDGGLLKKEPQYQAGDIVATENMPHHKCVELHHKGVSIFKCNTDLTKQIREKEGIEKTDDNDAKIIYEQFEKWRVHQNDETFRKFAYDVYLERLSYLTKAGEELKEIRKKAKQRVANDPTLAAMCDEEVKESINAVNRHETKLKRHLTSGIDEGGEEIGSLVYKEYLKDIDGLGISSAASLITIIKDIERFSTVSKLWAYFGLDVRNGKAPKRKKGELANWSQRGRSLVLHDIVSNGFKMCGAATSKRPEPFAWRAVYDDFKNQELEKNETRTEEEKLSNGHMDNRAIRRTGKEFLKRLYNQWKILNKEVHSSG